MRSTNSLFTRSPAKFTTRTAFGRLPTSTIAFTAEGTVLTIVISIDLYNTSSMSRTTVTVDPVASGTKHSYTAKSKLREVENSVRDKTSLGTESFPQQIKLT